MSKNNSCNNFDKFYFLNEEDKKQVIEFFLKKFHALPCSYVYSNTKNMTPRSECIENIKYEAMRNGVVFINKNNKMANIDTTILEIANSLFGVSSKEWSKSFHKTFKNVADKDIEQLIIEQLIHYSTTYGGLGDEIYIPDEKVEDNGESLPNFNALTVVQILPDKEIIEKFTDFVTNVKAPNNDETKAISIIMNTLHSITPESLTSFELRAIRYTQLGIIPNKGEEWLRYIIYNITGSSLLIKDKRTIKKVKNNNYFPVDKYLTKISLIELAEIFFRFKPLFLAMRYYSDESRKIINYVRKLADKYHKPTEEISSAKNFAEFIQTTKLTPAIINCVASSYSVRSLIKIINYLNNCINRTDEPCLYNIRNNKIYVTDKKTSTFQLPESYLIIVRDSILQVLKQKVHNSLSGQCFYIPNYIKYACPISEKQFVTNIPFGTSVSIPDNKKFVVAIYWENYNGRQTDLDLHLNSEKEHYGWYGAYYDETKDGILYSGDITNAPEGAVEAFLFNPHKANDENFVLTVNKYQGNSGVPFKFFMTTKGFDKNKDTYCVEIKDALFAPIPMKFNSVGADDSSSNSFSLGVFDKENFYFYNGRLGDSIIPQDYYPKLLKALSFSMSNMFGLSEFLKMCGAKIYSENSFNDLTNEEKSVIMNHVIDLSPSVVTSKILMDLIDTVDKISEKK